MSTPAQVPTAPVDPNLQTAQQIADQLAAAAAPANNAVPTQEPAVEQGFHVSLETGQTYSGKTKDELIQQLVKAQENASKRITQLSKTPAPAPVQAPPTATPQFDQNQYWQMMSTDPLAAAEYQLQFTPAAQALQRQVKEYGDVIEGIRNQSIANQFKSETPDLPIDDDSLAKFDKVWGEANLPLNVMNLKLVHAYCVANKVYSPATQVSAAPMAQVLPNPTLSAPGASSAPTQQITDAQVNQMTTAQLAEYIARLQQ